MTEKIMNLAIVAEDVNRIRGMADDAEAAHSAEDDLRGRLLFSIANGACEDPQACAAEALKTDLIDFPRWCA